MGHVDGLLLYETVALVQLAHQQLAAAEKVHQVVLVERYARRYITVTRRNIIII